MKTKSVTRKKKNGNEHAIPRSLAPAFPEYRLRDLSPRSDASMIIERTLEHGTRKELNWLFENYSAARVRKFVTESGARRLSVRAFNYWRVVLKVKYFRHPPFEQMRQALWGR